MTALVMISAHAARAAAQTHEHGSPKPGLTYTELQRTSEQLAAARQATAKYRDVRKAEADGYRAIGPYVAGMGVHYVRSTAPKQFSITEPPILLYERDSTGAGGLRLVALSYLLVAPTDSEGRPESPPLPNSLAGWHKHNNVCVLPDHSASVQLSEAQCKAQSGQFTQETSWMLHAWIWKDSPAGVFSFINPLVK